MRLHFDEIRYDRNILVKTGDLDIEKGSIVLIKGRNGKGKSSLIRNMFLNEANSNLDMVYIDQKNRKLNKKLGVIGNISMRCDEEINNRLIPEIEKLGCSFLLNKKVNCLSGGEKRLIYILRAYFSDESIVILDEPTNDLDYKSVELVKTILFSMKNSKAIILISHDSRIAEISDDIYEIRDKELINLKKVDHTSISERNYNACHKDKAIISFFLQKNVISIAILVIMVYILIKGMKADVLDRGEKKQVESIDECIISFMAPDAIKCDKDAMVPLAMSRIVEKKDMTAMIKWFYKQSDAITDVEFGKKLVKKFRESVKYEFGYCETDDYIVYPIQYDPSPGLPVRIFDYYATHCYPDMDPYDIYVDSSKYFERGSKSDHYLIKKELNLDEYIECVNELKNVYPVGAVVVQFKNENGLEAFLNSEYGRVLSDLNFSIYKPEFRDFIYETKAISDFLKRVEQCMYMIVLCIFCSVIMLIVQLMYYKDPILVLRNHNYMLEDIEDYLVNKFSLRIIRIMIALVVLSSNCWLYKDFAFSSVNYYWSLLGVLSVSFMFEIENQIASFYLKRLYRWEEQ